jgi:K+-transporting ATPase ATPase C chain
MKNSWTEIRTSIMAVAVLTVILGGVYPLSVWLLNHALFASRANGSMIVRNGTIVGSILIGQRFEGSRYFHPRPSAAGPGYDAFASGGSNLGPLSKTLAETVERRLAEYRMENGMAAGAGVPADAVTASGSGLDPHISPENARLQASRVAKARGMETAAVLRLIAAHTQNRQLGFLGNPRVNVLKLNLALDGVSDDRR